ncbi:Mor transcription activator family protein [Aneurinibacillus danicus]|uniref:Mor transcription activator domain-containing protein n=1 Tax=Aneurinibacillus danicus TaxID=267746 RepID=A0A511V899_9BACL|nr:Mor transcription activator family protein [Aneurinibacillus danicus]GEN35100.1 hypothetical protein ADA01nite_25600 [Aneurinibacillus danicus]
MYEIDFSPVIKESQPDDLPRPYNDIARVIGIENALKLAFHFGGTYQYLPKYSKATITLLKRLMPIEFKRGLDYKDIARKFGVSESLVRVSLSDNKYNLQSKGAK